MAAEDAAEAGHAGAEPAVLVVELAMHDQDVALLRRQDGGGGRNVLDGGFEGVERQSTRLQNHLLAGRNSEHIILADRDFDARGRCVFDDANRQALSCQLADLFVHAWRRHDSVDGRADDELFNLRVEESQLFLQLVLASLFGGDLFGACAGLQQIQQAFGIGKFLFAAGDFSFDVAQAVRLFDAAFGFSLGDLRAEQ